MKFTGKLACSIALLTLAGCGGEDAPTPAAGTGGTPAPPSSPTPTPTPTPSPSKVLLTPFGLRQDAQMALLGVYTVDGQERWLAADDVQMRWLDQPGTFALSIPPGLSGRLADDPDNAARAALFLQDDQGRRLARVNGFIPDPETRYSVLALYWTPLEQTPPAQASRGAFLYFPASAIQSPPAAGLATYSFGLPQQPSLARLTIDFTAGVVTGEVPMTWSDAFGPYPEVRYRLQGGRYDRANGSFTGRFEIPQSGFTGEVRGQIVGSSGDAMAIVIRGAVLNPYDSTWQARTDLVDLRRD